MRNSSTRCNNGFFQHVTVAATLAFGVTVFSGSAAAQVAGVTNYHQVNEHIYRGAQPTDAGFQNLAKSGIKIVIDLRETDSRSVAEKKVVEAAGMRYINIPMYGMSAPPQASVDKVMALFNDTSTGPVFIHCKRGADRTGTVVAVYRVAHDGWTNAKALSEAKANGMSWVEVAMQHYVMQYQPPTTNGLATTVAVGNNQ